MGQLMDAWKRLQMDMEVDRLKMQIDTQQKMLEAQKSMWDIHKLEMEMWDNPTKKMEEKQTKLNIQNIQKLENQRLEDSTYYPRIDTIEERDNEYVFTIMVDSGTALQPNRKVVWLERNKSFTTDGGINFYTLWAGDENFDSVSSMCISNLECFKEKLVDMVGVMDLSNRTFPTSSIAQFSGTTSVSGGDSAKLQQISDLLNGI
jgi:hypothetical protein